MEESKPDIIFEAWDEGYLESITAFLQTFKYKVSKIDKFNYIAKPGNN